MLPNISNAPISHATSANAIATEPTCTCRTIENRLLVHLAHDNQSIDTFSLYLCEQQMNKADTLNPIECTETSLKVLFANLSHRSDRPGFKLKDSVLGIAGIESAPLPELNIDMRRYETLPARALADNSPSGTYHVARMQFSVLRTPTSIGTHIARLFKRDQNPLPIQEDQEPLLASTTKQKETQRYLIGLCHLESKNFFTYADQLNPTTQIGILAQRLLNTKNIPEATTTSLSGLSSFQSQFKNRTQRQANNDETQREAAQSRHITEIELESVHTQRTLLTHIRPSLSKATSSKKHTSSKFQEIS